MLLNNLEEATFNAQDPETGNSKELYSSKNISLNGVGVRGDLQTTRMSKRATFGTHAQHDHGMSLENVTAKEITSSYGDGACHAVQDMQPCAQQPFPSNMFERGGGVHCHQDR